jgi:hypothetical protein
MGNEKRPPVAGFPLLTQLIRAHEEELRLTRELLLAQGLADEQEAEAGRAFDQAAACPGDEELADYAVEAGVASDKASERELEAAERWSCHRVWTRGLLEEAQTLISSAG